MSDDNKFLHIIANLTDVIWTKDLYTNKYTYVSPTVTSLLGYSVEEAMNEVFDNDSNHNESYWTTRNEIIKEIERLITTNEDYSDMKFEYQMANKEGVQIWLETEIRILKENGCPKELLGITRDIENRKKKDLQLENYAKELEKLNFEKDQFIKILAHDLLSPFNSMLGFSSNILETFKESSIEDLETQFRLVNKKIESTYYMLEDLLIWAKNSTSKTFSTFEKVHLNEVCNNIIKSMASNFKNISVVYFESEKIILQTDGNILKVILRNLISNATKFTDTNGEIRVFATKTTEYVTITVSDNGIGMTEEQTESLWQKSKSTIGTNGEKGFGLGLIFCKELVEKLGGNILVESELGKGSSFKISLPITHN